MQMQRLIDANALRTVKSIQSADFNSIESIQKWIDDAPTVHPKLYGYRIKDLAVVAEAMQMKGIDAEDAVEMFSNVASVVKYTLDCVHDKIDKAFTIIAN